MSDACLLFAADVPSSPPMPMIVDPVGHLAVLLGVLAIIFIIGQDPRFGRIFKIIPALVFCYFVPTALTAFHVIPAKSELYDWVTNFVLPASLFLLTLNLDLRGIIRLGPKAGAMLIAGTIGVVLGGPIAVWIWQSQLPDAGYMPLSYLAGSWIGGGANAVALQKSFGIPNSLISSIVVVDVAVANIWMAGLLFFAGRPHVIDRWLKGDTTAIRELETRMEDYQASVARQATVGDFIAMLAMAFGAAWYAQTLASWLITIEPFSAMTEYIGSFAWKVIIVTIFGVGASFTKARQYEGAGASRIGSVMIYLLVACIGAGASFEKLAEAKGYLLIGATWMLVHITIMLIVAKLIRAPFFYVAVGSKANIGGAASAPVVASAFNPVLAPVGAILAIAGYVLGTFAGLVCVWLMQWVMGGAGTSASVG